MPCCKDLGTAVTGVAVGIYIANLIHVMPWMVGSGIVLPFAFRSTPEGNVGALGTAVLLSEAGSQLAQLGTSSAGAPSSTMPPSSRAVAPSANATRNKRSKPTTTPLPPRTTSAPVKERPVPEAFRNASFRMPDDLQHCPGVAAWVHDTVSAQFEPWRKAGVTDRMAQVSNDLPDSNACCYPMYVKHGKVGGPGADSTWAKYLNRAIKRWPFAREELRDFHVSQTACDWPAQWKEDPRTDPSRMAPVFGNANNGNFREILMPVQIRPQFDETFVNKRAVALELGKRPWSKRKDIAVWRGNIGCTIGCGPRGKAFFPDNHIQSCVEDTHPGSNADVIGFSYGCAEEKSGPKSGAWMRHPRVQLVNLSAVRGKECGIDAKFPELSGEHRPFMARYGVDLPRWTSGKYMNDDETSRHRYVFHVANNGYADRSWRMFALGGVVLLVDNGWKEWYFSFLEPYVHYIPVKADMSDACEQLAWARASPEKAEAIANRGRAFIEDCMPVGMINLYTAEVMRQYGQLWARGHGHL
mmetsp:Transcript_38071/g.100718  ORF Transcript_38071/g.100718 Transcript_38071/m.100718 type:complete len:526 (+) Transcript_38071:30-1607(+)